jgi:hypothetical protein
MRPNGIQRQIDMAVKSSSNWPKHKIQEAKQIFRDTATILDEEPMNQEFFKYQNKQYKLQSKTVDDKLIYSLFHISGKRKIPVLVVESSCVITLELAKSILQCNDKTYEQGFLAGKLWLHNQTRHLITG